MLEDQKRPELKNLAILKKMGGPDYYTYVWQKVDRNGDRKNLGQRDLNYLHKGIEPDNRDLMAFGKLKVPRVAGQYIKLYTDQLKKTGVSPKKKRKKENKPSVSSSSGSEEEESN